MKIIFTLTVSDTFSLAILGKILPKFPSTYQSLERCRGHDKREMESFPDIPFLRLQTVTGFSASVHT